MNSRARDQREAPPGRGRIVALVAAALVAVAVVVLIRQSDGPEAHEADRAPSETADDAGAARLDAQATRPLAGDAASSAPTLLLPSRAALHVEFAEAGLHASHPMLQLSRADGWTDARHVPDAAGLWWRDLPAGRYAVAVLGGGWEADETSVELAADEPHTLRLRSSHSVEVRVVGSRTGQPVPVARADVRLWLQDSSNPVVDDAPVDAPEGRFNVLGLLERFPDGEEVLGVAFAARTPLFGGCQSGRLPVRELGPEGVTLVVPEPALTGMVQRWQSSDPPGSQVLWPVDNARIVLIAADGNLSDALIESDQLRFAAEGGCSALLGDGATAADGTFQLHATSFPEGGLRIVALASGSAPWIGPPFPMAADSAARHVDVVLEPGAQITGTVWLPSGAKDETAPPLRVSHVAARWLGTDGGDAQLGAWSTWNREERDEATGATRATFAFASLPAGDYEVAVTLQPDGRSASQPAARRFVQRTSVQTGGTRDLSFDATRPTEAGSLAGSLRWPATQGDAGDLGLMAQVSLWPAGAERERPLFRIQTRLDGRFEAADLAPGNWTLLAVASDIPDTILAVASASVHVDLARSELPPLELSGTELVFHGPADQPLSLELDGPAGDAGIEGLFAEGSVLLSFGWRGTARVIGLPPGRYRATGGGKTQAFEIAPGASLMDVELN